MFITAGRIRFRSWDEPVPDTVGSDAALPAEQKADEGCGQGTGAQTVQNQPPYRSSLGPRFDAICLDAIGAFPSPRHITFRWLT